MLELSASVLHLCFNVRNCSASVQASCVIILPLLGEVSWLSTAGLVGLEIIDNFQCFFVQRFAKALAGAVFSLNLPVEIINMEDYDPEDGLVEEVGMA